MSPVVRGGPPAWPPVVRLLRGPSVDNSHPEAAGATGLYLGTLTDSGY